MAQIRKRAKKNEGQLERGGEKKDICFVIMPFGGWFDRYFNDVYSPAIKAAGLEDHRVDDLFRPSVIVSDIWDYTNKAKIILADLTGKNPNVFYELGLAHALGKPAVLIAESMDDVPFDLRNLRIIIYNKNVPEWGAVLGESVTMALKEVISSPKEAVLPIFLKGEHRGAEVIVTPIEKQILELRNSVQILQRRLALRGPEADRIGPVEAEALINQWVAEGLPLEDIARRLTRRGAPSGWIDEKLSRFRSPFGPELRSEEPGHP